MNSEPVLLRPEESSYASRRALFWAVFPPIMLPIFLAVADGSTVSTALPAIARSLGEVERVVWVVVSYLVANTIAAPVYGRMADIFGRRTLMLVALATYMAGSIGCAAAPSMTVLTLFRCLQGLGGGGLMTLSQALIGESVPARERGHFQGHLATMIVLGSTIGPVAGGFLTQWFGWRSIFLVTLPLTILAMLLVLRLPKRPGTGGRVAFDGLGLILLTSFVTPLLVAMEQIKRLNPEAMGIILGLIGLSVAALVTLIWQEKRAASPLLPVGLLSHAAIWRSNGMSACAGASLTSQMTFLPLYLQVVDGATPSEIGFLLLPFSAGVGLGSVMTGRMISRTGRTAIFPSIGLAVTSCSLIALAFFASDLSRVELPMVMIFGAFCQGSAMPVAQLTVQHIAGPRQLGAASGAIQLSRSLGSALGVALVGAVLFTLLSLSGTDTASLFFKMVQLGPSVMDSLDATHRAMVQNEVASAFRAVFLTIASFSVCIVLLAWTLPIRRL